MTEKPKPLPYYFYKTEDFAELIHERNEALKKIARLKAELEKAEMDRLMAIDMRDTSWICYRSAQNERDEARAIARRLYRENAELQRQRDDYHEVMARYQDRAVTLAFEVEELRRQLAIANRALEWYSGAGVKDGATLHNCEIATNALIEMRGGYKSARGILPWKEGDEPAEQSIRRLRGNEK